MTLVAVHEELSKNLTWTNVNIYITLLPIENRVCVYFSCLFHELERHIESTLII